MNDFLEAEDGKHALPIVTAQIITQITCLRKPFFTIRNPASKFMGWTCFSTSYFIDMNEGAWYYDKDLSDIFIKKPQKQSGVILIS